MCRKQKFKNKGSPACSEIMHVASGKPLVKELDMRENDVYFLNLIKL
jgi:xylan 1,4-beta-xylosidase